MNDLRDAPVDRKVVAVRVDLNVPTDGRGRITDDTRIVAALPTINYLTRSGAKALLLSHFGRPKGPARSIDVAGAGRPPRSKATSMAGSHSPVIASDQP